jgi:hypothetical protein
MGELTGWERANWFADEGQAEVSVPGGGRTGSTTPPPSTSRVRENVGLFDMSSFGKIRVEGRDASFLNQRLCGATTVGAGGQDRLYPDAQQRAAASRRCDRDPAVGDGLSCGHVPGATRQRDLSWLRRLVGDRFVVITDVTARRSAFWR